MPAPRRRRETVTDGEMPPPRASRPSTAGSAPRAGLEDKLNEFVGVLALMFQTFGDEHCAAILAERGPLLTESWVKLAKQNAGVARVLNRMVEGGAWGGVIVSTAAVALPIASHHGLPVPDLFSLMFPGSRARPSSQSSGGWDWSTAPGPTPGATGTHVSSDTPGTRGEEVPEGVVTVAGGPDNSTIVTGALE